MIIFDFLDEGFTLYCNAEVSGGDGLNANVGAVATGNVELTLKTHTRVYRDIMSDLAEKLKHRAGS